MTAFEAMCREFGVPLNKEKTQGPTTCLVFLGFEIDTLKMLIKIPSHNFLSFPNY